METNIGYDMRGLNDNLFARHNKTKTLYAGDLENNCIHVISDGQFKSCKDEDGLYQSLNYI